MKIRNFFHKNSFSIFKLKNHPGSLSDVISKCDDELPAAYVEIHLTDSPEAIFRRNVTSKNVVTYFINGKPVTLKQYHEGLLNYKIDMIGNSSLIFQGAIGNVVQRNPVDMAKLFDSISGSHLLDAQYRELKNSIDKLDAEYHDMCVRKNHLEKQAKRYRQMSNNESEFKKLLTRQVSIRTFRTICLQRSTGGRSRNLMKRLQH